MMRHLVKTVSVAAGIALLAAGCGGGSSGAGAGTSAGDGKVTIKVALWNYSSTPEFKALIEGFQASHPDITVQPVDILADDYPQKVTTMLAGGDTTDVLTMKNVIDYSRYANRNQLLPLTPEAGGLDKASYPGLPAYDLDGKYFALPYRQDFWVLYYNKALLTKAGVPESSLTSLTWAEYAALAEKLTSGSGSGTVYGTYLHTWRSVVQAIAAAQTGGDLLGGDYTFMKDQYTVALDLQKAGATMPFATAFSQKVTYKSMFSSGKAATMPMGTWYAASLIDDVAKGKVTVDWGMAPLPQATKDGKTVTFGSPTAFAVNKKSKNADAAKKFVTWAAGPDGAQVVAKTGTVPALASDAVLATYFGVKGIPSGPLAEKAFHPDKVVLEMPVSDRSSDVDLILNEEHQLVMTGEKPLDAGIKEMGSRVKSEVG